MDKYIRSRHGNVVLYGPQQEFNYMVRNNDLDRIRKFIDEFGHSYLSGGNNYPIRTAAKEGYVGLVEFLLTFLEIDPSENRSEALRSASYNGHHKIVEMLLKDGRADPSSINNKALRDASRKGHLFVVQRLIRDPRVDIGAANYYAVKVCIGRKSYRHREMLVLFKREIMKKYKVIYLARMSEHNNVIKWLPQDIFLRLMEDVFLAEIKG